MMTPNVVYSRLRLLLLIAPLWWLLTNPVNALTGPNAGDDLSKAFSSKPSKRQSELSERSASLPDDDDSDLSDSEYSLDDELTSPSKKSSSRKSSSFSETMDLDAYDDGEFSFKNSFLQEEMPLQGKEAMYEAYNQLHTLAQVR